MANDPSTMPEDEVRAARLKALSRQITLLNMAISVAERTIVLITEGVLLVREERRRKEEQLDQLKHED